jgi:hypothetical protein
VIDKLWAEIREIDKEDSGAKRYYAAETIQMVPMLNKVGAFPAKYCSL